MSLRQENAAIELHDSKLERIERRGDDLVVILGAYVHRPSGRPGIDAGSGWKQEAHLVVRRGRAADNTSGLPVRLADGHIQVSGETLDNMIPVPFELSGPSHLQLHTAEGHTLVIDGEGVTASLIGDPKYIEEYKK